MNKVVLTGRLTRDPEMRKLASGKTVTTFAIATNDYRGRNNKEQAEFHTIVTWDRLAEICAEYLSKGSLIAVEGRIQTRHWEDENKLRHYRTEIVAGALEMLSGRRKKDYAADSAAQALVTQAEANGFVPATAEADDEDADIVAATADAQEADEAALVAA